MTYRYTAQDGATPIADPFEHLYASLDADCESVWREAGFPAPTLVIGDDLGTSLNLRVAQGRADYECHVDLSLSGDALVEYLMPTIHDAVCFLKEFLPTIETLMRLETQTR